MPQVAAIMATIMSTVVMAAARSATSTLRPLARMSRRAIMQWRPWSKYFQLPVRIRIRRWRTPLIRQDTIYRFDVFWLFIFTKQLKELLVAIRSVVTKYQANFDAKATQDILDRTTLLKEFIISLDYDNMADTFQDDLYNLVDKLALSVRSAFLTILTGFDGLTGMTRDPTPEIALDRSKVASVCSIFDNV